VIQLSNDEQRVLAFAALAYQGMDQVHTWDTPTILRSRIQRMLDGNLAARVGAGWQLSFGPAVHRGRYSLLDDEMMFVAKNEGGKYVIAIRGTNPLCALDWLFGDFWVDLKRKWPWPTKNASQAHVSFSTALGLDTLLRMRDGVSHVGWAVGEAEALVRRAVHRVVNTGVRLAPRVRSLCEEHGYFMPYLLPLSDLYQSLRQTFVHLSEEWGGFPRAARHWSSLEHRFEEVSSNILLRDLQQVGLEAKGGTRKTLLQYIASEEHVEEIVVTGHSKGGALAVALALWLADAKTAAGGALKNAKVKCYSYAGPMSGDQAFADHALRQLDTIQRIVVDRDVVPRAWESKAIGETLRFYGDPIRALLAAVVEATEGLRYAHVQGGLTTIKSDDQGGDVGEIVYQHLEAYLTAGGFRLPDLGLGRAVPELAAVRQCSVSP
jgi:hypothetical protein